MIIKQASSFSRQIYYNDTLEQYRIGQNKPRVVTEVGILNRDFVGSRAFKLKHLSTISFQSGVYITIWIWDSQAIYIESAMSLSKYHILHSCFLSIFFSTVASSLRIKIICCLCLEPRKKFWKPFSTSLNNKGYLQQSTREEHDYW